jgi:hypothetical protein
VRRDGSDGTSSLSSVFLLDDLGTLWLPEAVQFTNLARCERRRHRRGAIRLIRHIRSIRPPFVCGAGPLGCGIYDGGGVRMHRDRADPPDPSPTGLTGQRNEPGSWFNGLRDAWASRGRSPKTRETVRRHRSRLRARNKSATIGEIDVRNPRQVFAVCLAGCDECSAVRQPRSDADRSTGLSAPRRPTAGESGGHREAARGSAPTSRARVPPRTSA